MQTKMSKALVGIAAGSLAVSMVFSGTYAWQSISQRARNQAVGYANYGGRLHDDFDGTNKDVYVENFTVEDENGAPIFVRVRLDEYMETGMEAGTNATGTTRKATPLVTGATLSDKNKWTTYIPGSTTDPFRDYWELKMGGETVYMPTFDKNQDSLAVDVNGTYEGPDGKTDAPNADRYLDYVTYTVGQEKTAQAVYDMDDNDIDEGSSAVVGTNITQKQETHAAKMTQKAEVITMEQWKTEKNYALGKYWVYDTDGWAYWGEALQPGDTTGLLLDAVTMKKIPDTHWYYGINVVGQFASVRDWGTATDKDGFYDPTGNSKAPTEDALLLLTLAAGQEIEVASANNVTDVLAGDTLQFNANLALSELENINRAMIWDVTGETSADTKVDEKGLLTVGADETIGGELTVTATPATSTTLRTSGSTLAGGSFKITVAGWNGTLTALSRTPGSTGTVNIDGIDWYVVARNGDQALLWSKELIASFGTSSTTASNQLGHQYWWNSSCTARTWLNGTFLNGLTTLKDKAVATTIYTRSSYNSSSFNATTDKVFLPSETDFTGLNPNSGTADSRDYSYSNTKLVTPGSDLSKCASFGNATYYWTRTMTQSNNSYIAIYSCSTGTWTYTNYNSTTTAGVRPMMWVNMR